MQLQAGMKKILIFYISDRLIYRLIY